MSDDLIARLEKATGPDRELDWAISEALNVAALEYTSSIDAALTLVPEGWLLQLSDWEDRQLRDAGPWQVVLVQRGKRGDMRHAFDARCDHAPTAALALVIAALKARASLAKDKL